MGIAKFPCHKEVKEVKEGRKKGRYGVTFSSVYPNFLVIRKEGKEGREGGKEGREGREVKGAKEGIWEVKGAKEGI